MQFQSLYQNHLYDLDFVDDSTGWICGQPHLMLHTTDHGASWSYQIFPGDTIAGISFVDRNQGWATTAAGDIYRTVDAGGHWTPLASNRAQASWFTDIWFADAQRGWHLSANSLGRTTDSGGSWNFAAPLPSGAFVGGIFHVSADEAWCPNGTNRLWHTTDFGGTWVPQAVDSISRLRLSDVTFLNPVDGWTIGSVEVGAHGYLPYLYRTTDGGAQWNSVEIPSTFDGYFREVHFFDQSEGIIFRSDDSTLVTHDGGITWHLTVLPLPASGTGQFIYSFPGPQVVWRIEDSGLIQVTTDRGNRWQDKGPANEAIFRTEIRDIQFITPSQGWVCSSSGLIQSTDSGITWSLHFPVNAPGVRSLAFADSENGLAVDDRARVFRTTDGGTNWATLGPIMQQPLVGLSFHSPGCGWAIQRSMWGTRTVDGGRTWMAWLFNTTYDFVCVENWGVQGCWIGNNHGHIIFSLDTGNSWNSRAVLDGPVSKICFATALDGWAIGEAGQIARTSDGGMSWTNQESGIAATLQDVRIIQTGTTFYGWITAPDAFPIMTRDGEHWIPVDPGYPLGWRNVTFTDSQNVWLVGEGNAIIHYTCPSPATAIETTPLPQRYGLSVYPNPFNSVATVRCELERESDIILDVHDISGRLVTRLASGRWGAGVHTVQWSGTNCSSGLYFIRFRNHGKDIGIQKVVLLK